MGAGAGVGGLRRATGNVGGRWNCVGAGTPVRRAWARSSPRLSTLTHQAPLASPTSTSLQIEKLRPGEGQRSGLQGASAAGWVPSGARLPRPLCRHSLVPTTGGLESVCLSTRLLPSRYNWTEEGVGVREALGARSAPFCECSGSPRFQVPEPQPGLGRGMRSWRWNT